MYLKLKTPFSVNMKNNIISVKISYKSIKKRQETYFF